ncbi:MAG: hypothetical protein WBB27_00970 [Maribacter sp.]
MNVLGMFKIASSSFVSVIEGFAQSWGVSIRFKEVEKRIFFDKAYIPQLPPNQKKLT